MSWWSRRRSSSPRPLGLRILVVAVGALVVLTAGAYLADPLDLSGSGSGHFPNALEWAAPDDSWNERGFAGATAEALNAAGGQGREFNKRLRLVDADTPSTSNLVVSVHPIDQFTWAATALASNNRCYGILLIVDRANPNFGTTRYAKFAVGSRCQGRLATSKTVRMSHAPD